MLKHSIIGSRVRSKENFADTGTRPELASQFQEGLRKLEEQYGWQARKVEVPAWLRDMGWDALSKDLPPRDWFGQAESYLTWLQAEHPNLIAQRTGVSGAEVVAVLQAAKRGEPLSESLNADGDFPTSGMSKARRLTVEVVPLTAMQLQRTLHSHTEKHGKLHGPEKFCTDNHFDKGTDPQLVISSMLQQKHKYYYDLVATTNRSYDPSFERESLPPLKPLSLPAHHRLQGDISIHSIFSGSGLIDESFRCSGFAHSTAHVEQVPALRQLLQSQHPSAQSFSSVSDYVTQLERFSCEILQSSPPCPSHSVANLYRAGNLDEFGGLHWQDSSIPILKALPVVLNVDASQTVSPASSLQSPVKHERVHAIFWKKSCFSKEPAIKHLVNQSQPLQLYRSFLDKPQEGQEYRVMPDLGCKFLDFSQ